MPQNVGEIIQTLRPNPQGKPQPGETASLDGDVAVRRQPLGLLSIMEGCFSPGHCFEFFN
jgi:hypothetical protein